MTDKRVIRMLATVVAFAAGGCAGATVGSGVGDRLMEQPPWIAGSGAAPAAVAHLPMRYQRGADQEPFLEPPGGPGSAIDQLLGELNRGLDRMGSSRPVAAPTPAQGTPPDVFFGCETTTPGECTMADPGRPLLRLAVGRPSASWTSWAVEHMTTAGADAVLVITLEVGQVMPRQRNILGSKVVDLGTGYSVSLPWLTSLETPVSILQLTGALIDRNGKAIRIGAEGLLARRTSLLASSVGLQALITDEEVGELLAARRDDLPGRPPVHETALRTLVEHLVR